MRCGLVCALAVLTIALPGPVAAAAPRDDAAPLAVTLAAPAHVRYGRRAVFTGSATGALPGTPVVTLLRDGSPLAQGPLDPATGAFAIVLRLVAPGAYQAQLADAVSAPTQVALRPRLQTSLRRTAAVGSRLVLSARVVPAAAGRLRIRVVRNGRETLARAYRGRARITLGTVRPASLRVAVRLEPEQGWTALSRALRAQIVQPQLGRGAAGASVTRLRQRLHELAYAVPIGSGFDFALTDSVLAFQKVQGLPRTGVVDGRVWNALARPRPARPRYAAPADHLEIDKSRQVLLVVRGGRAALIVPVSTAGIPGTFTPVGRFAIYRKVGGFDPSPLGTLFDPMYFAGGYAIHGNPSVPAFPASHGCVRVPMWIAGYLYATNDYGETVYVY